MSTTRRTRPKRLRSRPPDLTETGILSWCDEHHERTGEWPTQASGRVQSTVNENWNAIDMALRNGYRGLPGKSSLAKLLAECRDVRNRKGLPELTEEAIASLAEVHFRAKGEWPTRQSGSVSGSPVPGETWKRINDALTVGLRGLPGGSSLAQLLEKHRGVRNRKALPPLVEAEIVRWAQLHFERKGLYPSEKAGPVEDAPGETWSGISMALRSGIRGLPGGSSLYQLLASHGLVPGQVNASRLRPGGHLPVVSGGS